MVIGVIPRPKILTGQPQSAVSIDWSNPNARGLIGAWTASTPSLLGGNSAPSGTIITTEPTPGGRVWRGTDAATSDNCIRIPRGPMTYTQECTFEVLFRLNTQASNGNIGIMSQYQTVSGVDVYGPTMGFTTGYYVSRINFAVRTGAAWRTVTSGSASDDGIVAGELAHVVCTASVAAGSMLNIYINAVIKGGASFFSGSFTNDPDNFLSLLSRYADGGGNNCAGIDMYLARVYNVAKSPTEIQALYKDPWGMFKQTQFLHTDSTASPTSRTFFVPRKKVMTSQPQGPAAAIDWGNPITRGLASAYIPTAAQYRSFDLATNTRDLASNADYLPPYRPGAAGFALDSTDTNYVWTIAFDPVALRGYPKTGYAAITVFSLFESRTTNQFGVIYGGGNDGTYYGRLVVSSDATIAFIAASNNATLHPKAPLVADTLYAATGIQSFTRSYRALYVNGHLAETRTESINNLNNGFIAGSIYNVQLRRIKLYCGYVWVRELSAAEIKSLSDNPWQIFKQDRLSPALAEDGKVYAPFMS